jgi:hypothetical protein
VPARPGRRGGSTRTSPWHCGRSGERRACGRPRLGARSLQVRVKFCCTTATPAATLSRLTGPGWARAPCGGGKFHLGSPCGTPPGQSLSHGGCHRTALRPHPSHGMARDPARRRAAARRSSAVQPPPYSWAARPPGPARLSLVPGAAPDFSVSSILNAEDSESPGRVVHWPRGLCSELSESIIIETSISL